MMRKEKRSERLARSVRPAGNSKMEASGESKEVKRGGSIVVIIDGSVAFQGESKPAAWAFVAAAGRGEIYRLCKSHWPIE